MKYLDDSALEYLVGKIKTCDTSGDAGTVNGHTVNSDVPSGAVFTDTRVLKVTKSSFSSLPQTISNSKITADHEVIHAVLGTPSALTGDWTITTAAGKVTISGTMTGSTTLTLYLEVPVT